MEKRTSIDYFAPVTENDLIQQHHFKHIKYLIFDLEIDRHTITITCHNITDLSLFKVKTEYVQ